MMQLATASSTAGVITATASLFIAVAGVIAALTTFIPMLRSQRRTEQKVDQVHELVNGQNTALVARNDSLTSALVDAGVPVPVPPNHVETIDHPTG